MKRLAWLTDIHLEFLDPAEVMDFCRVVARVSPDAILIGGDIGNATSVEGFLTLLAGQWQKPIYFVLGNHDFYRGSIAQVRATAARLAETSPWLHWLTISGVVALTPNTGLIGHGSWGDGRMGSAERSQTVLNDYFQIQEFFGLSPSEWFAQLNALGDEAASHLQDLLPQALSRFRRLLLLTHVPPFKESCWHEGRIADDDFLPHFTCSAVARVLAETMPRYPDRHLTVLCGHTHGQGKVQIMSNLLVKTGGAEYGFPSLQAVITIP
jgi:Icc-related predicted phosphoesterase